MKETSLMALVQIEASKRGARVFRNNVGLWTLADGRKMRTGLCVGSSDLIGFTKDGRFLAIEVKTSSGRLTKPQQHFLDAVNAAGGVGICARSVDDLNIL